jgi:hypothetical protein
VVSKRFLAARKIAEQLPVSPCGFRTLTNAGQTGPHRHVHLRDVNPVRLGREFNAAFMAAPADLAGDRPLPPEHSFLSHDNPALAVSAVKLAEDGDDLIVRLCEPYDAEARTTLAGVAADQVSETDLLERTPREAPALVFRPHEIKTVRASASYGSHRRTIRSSPSSASFTALTASAGLS